MVKRWKIKARGSEAIGKGGKGKAEARGSKVRVLDAHDKPYCMDSDSGVALVALKGRGVGGEEGKVEPKSISGMSVGKCRVKW